MGFYGKISNSNKTAFSFDRVYETRQAMDNAAASDGVFIGRYVLVEYDEPPITGYYDGTNFYSSIHQGSQSMIQPRVGVVYQDLVHVGSAVNFYRWDAVNRAYIALATTTGYAGHFTIDVAKYGRGYDSTAWMKTYDVQNNIYRYVLVAELNTVVPTFHLITDAPGANPVAPYFDQDTTTVDYYMHQQATYGVRIRPNNIATLGNQIDAQGQLIPFNIVDGQGQPYPATNVISLSDENVLMNYMQPETDANGVQTFQWHNDSTIVGDIYYNKEGFKKAIRTVSPRDNQGNPTIKNTINYDFNFSGRKYGGGVTDRGVWNEGTYEKDMMDWYIHLPILGDLVSEIWDIIYNYNSENIRYTKLAIKRNDDDGLVTYNPGTVYGALNLVRDVLGYPIKQLSELGNGVELDGLGGEVVSNTRTGSAVVANNLYYTELIVANKEEPVRDKYYYFTYDPSYVRVTYDSNNDVYKYDIGGGQAVTVPVEDLYFKDTNNIYRKPNLLDWPTQLSDGTWVGQEYNELYARQDAWKLVKLATPIEDSIYGLIIQLHRLMGDHSPDVRDENSIIGCINLTKDMIARIDKDLAPCKLIATTESGVIHTTDTEFPYYATQDSVTDKYGVAHEVEEGHECLTSTGLWRLITDYKLYNYSEMNNNSPLAYFDDAYYGNSNKHIVEQTDTVGTAIRKISNELADLNYESQTAKITVHAYVEGEANSEYICVENGRPITDVTIEYELNKGPRHDMTIDLVTTGSAQHNIKTVSISDTLAHLQPGYAATASETLHDKTTIDGTTYKNTDLTYRIIVTDERSQSASAEAVIKYMNKCYWGVGAEYAASAFGTLANINSALTGGSKLSREKFSPPTMNAGANQYIYWLQPATFADPIFRISCVEGGMDYLGTVNVRNAYDDVTQYKVWRSTQKNLGSTDLVVL